MSKLLKLKEWLNIADTAQHLSLILGEKVNEADVLRLGLDGHLKLSVYFVNHMRASPGKRVPLEQAVLRIYRRDAYANYALKGGKLFGPAMPECLGEFRVAEMPENLKQGLSDGSLVGTVPAITISPDTILEIEDKIVTLQGVWDLPLIGAERLDVEHQFQKLTGGPDVTQTVLDGAFVENEDGQLYQLQEHYSKNEYWRGDKKTLSYDDPSSYYPAGGLPADGVLVVRTSALAEFQQRLSEQPIDKPLGERERVTLLTIIAALAKGLEIDVSKPSKAGGQIANLADALGASVSQRAIEDHLKRIPDALQRRGRA